MDGNAAWKSLVSHFTSPNMAINVANTLRIQMTGIRLESGKDAGDFVNEFMVTFEKLSDLNGHRMHEAEAKTCLEVVEAASGRDARLSGPLAEPGSTSGTPEASPLEKATNTLKFQVAQDVSRQD